MWYTYGTSYNMIIKEFIPFTEPIKDLRIAAPFIGFIKVFEDYDDFTPWHFHSNSNTFIIKKVMHCLFHL